MTRRDVVVPGGMASIDVVGEMAERAEALGEDRISVTEVTGRDVVTVLATLAERTDAIGLSNDVLSPWGRSPAMLGQTGVTLQEASGGRYRMGLGTSSPALTEQWHLGDYDRPLRRLREAIAIVNQVASVDRLEYDGEVFDGGGLALRGVEPATVPVDVAALGPKTTELAGRFADGWVPQLLTTDTLADRLADLRRGADLGDRDPAGPPRRGHRPVVWAGRRRAGPGGRSPPDRVHGRHLRAVLPAVDRPAGVRCRDRRDPRRLDGRRPGRRGGGGHRRDGRRPGRRRHP